MNERIKELAEQADYEAPGGMWKEYFAELVIKECISQVEKDHFGGRESWDRSIDNSVNHIKTYFGVE